MTGAASRLAATGLVAASFLVSFIAFEAAARLLPGDWGLEPVREERIFCTTPPVLGRPDPELGWTRFPNARYYERQTPSDGWQAISIDDDGFRRTPLGRGMKGPGIVILGDSFAFGTLASDHETIAAVLQSMWPDMPIRNLGMVGYGTGQEWMAYRKLSGALDHRLAILIYYLGNDLKNNMRPDKYAPVFTNESDRIQIKRPRNVGYADASTPRRELRAKLRQYSYTFNAADRIISALGQRQFSSSEVEDGLKLTQSLIKAIGRDAEANGARLLIVVMPSVADVGPGGPTPQAERETAALKAEAETNDHLFTSLAPIISEAGGSALYGRDPHLTPAGYAVVAQAISRTIATTGLFAPPIQPANQNPASIVSSPPRCDEWPEQK